MSASEKEIQSHKEDSIQVWERKYDVSIEILKQEYLVAIDSVRYVDEKSSKYLIFLSLVFTGLFTILSSSLTDKVNFSAKISGCYSLINIFSYLFIFFLWLGVCFSIPAFWNLLKSMELVQTSRMPNMFNELNERRVVVVKFKMAIIQHYQNSVNKLKDVAASKQKYIRSAVKYILLCAVNLLIAFFFLFLIKFVGVS